MCLNKSTLFLGVKMNFIELQNYLISSTGKNVTQSAIAKALGVDRSTITTKIKNNKNVTLDELAKIEKNFNITKKQQECGFVSIPVRGHVRASMGYGVTVFDETQTGEYQISTKLAKDLSINAGQSEMIIASGDSMEPTIEGGDSLLIDTSQKEVYDGRIYCVRIEGQLYAKRLQKIPPSTIVVISDNQKYKSFEINFSQTIDYDFEVIGEVRWWGRVAR